MATFTYSAKSKDEKIRKGTITALTKSEAKVFLRKRGLRILSIAIDRGSSLFEGETSVIGNSLIRDEKGKYVLILGNQNPTTQDLVIFSKQLSTLIASGVPLLQSLSALEKQQTSRGFRRALLEIRQVVENGSSFSSALAQHPLIFDELYVAMVSSGELSGKLDLILRKLVTYIEKAQKIKSHLKSALTYPVIVLVLSIVVVGGLLTFVVPIFAQQFSESGRELPWLTQQVIDFSNFLQSNWYFIIAVFGLGFYFFQYWRRTPSGKKQFDGIILKLPVLGDVLQKIAIARFCSTMSSMLSSGVNLLQALTICAMSAGNKVIEEFVLGVKVSLEKGETFSKPLSEGTLFPVMVISMIQVGESTGALDEMLTKVSELYEEEVDVAVKTMLSLIEPFMIVFLGGIIAFVVIAMYLPIFELAGGGGGE